MKTLAKKIPGVIGTLLLTAAAASAQTYSIDTFTVAGGSGTVSSGSYSISGIIGQPDGNLAVSGGDFLLTGGFWSIAAATPSGTPLIVPGTANPWLAGMTNGFHEASGDVTPDESPVLFTNFTAGARLQFAASGSANYGGAASGPAGIDGSFVNHAAEEGIGPIVNSLANALIGVFLDDAQPDRSVPTPAALDFTSAASRNYVVLQPALNQPFYIGSGTNASGVQQSVVAPANATRLFLGIQDGFGWFNNSGSFLVTVGHAATQAQMIAFVNAPQVGNQNQGPYNLGLDFEVLAPITVRQMGAFDSGGDGFSNLIQVVLYNRDTATQIPGTLTSFTAADPGTLVGGSRFKDISPVTLGPGHYLVDAYGFGQGDPNGNSTLGSITTSFDNGGGLLSFNGVAPLDDNASLDFPTILAGNTFQPVFAAGTFSFSPTESASTTIFDNTAGSNNGGFGVTESSWLAGKFCLGSQAFTLDSIGVLLDSQDFSGAPGPPASVRLQLYSDDPVRHKPSFSTGLILDLVGRTNPITPLHGYEVVMWTPETQVSLLPNTCYWVVVSRESGGNIGVIASSAKPLGAAVSYGESRSADAGATWQVSDDSFTFEMLIRGTPISAPAAGPETAVDNSTPIPGGTGAFTSLPAAPSLNGNALAFFGAGASGQQGIYLTTRGIPGNPIRIADLNTAIPNGAGNFLSFATERGIIIVGGDILFAGSGTGSQQGVYLSSHLSPGTLVRIADTATAIPGGSGTFTGFQNALGFSGSDVAFVGSGSGGQQGIYGENVAAIGPPFKVADTTTAIPSGAGNFTGFPSGPAVSGTEVAFIGDGLGAQQGLYTAAITGAPQVGSPLRIADTTTAIPDGTGNFTGFGSGQAHPVDPALSGDRLAFVGSGSGGQQGIYGASVSAIGPPQKIADTATAIPGGNGNFASFDAVSVSATDVAFLGHGVGGQTGIYDSTAGQLRKVISVGDAIQGKTIAGLNFSRNGLFGDPIAFQATFSDGSQAAYTIDVPAPPAALRISALGRSGADLRLSFASVVGQNYVIQTRADLSSGTWTTVPGGPTAGTGGLVQVTLPNALNQPQQFYRVMTVP